MMRLETVDPVIPVSTLINRYEAIMEDARACLDKTAWWRFRRRLIFLGVIAAYQFEINAMLELAATTQPILRDLNKKHV